MDPILIAYMAKLGIDTVINIIGAWEESGRPNPDQIREAFINKKPKDFFKEENVG